MPATPTKCATNVSPSDKYTMGTNDPLPTGITLSTIMLAA